MIKNAVQPLTAEDHKANFDYRVGALFTLGTSTDADIYYQTTEKPQYPASWVLNQAEFDPANDECAAISGSRALSLMNGYAIGPHFLWMMGRQYAGMKQADFGLNNRSLSDTMRKIGALRREDEPFTFKDSRDVIQDPAKWPPLVPLEIKAAENVAGQTVTWIHPTVGKDGKMLDAFDVFRLTIMKLNRMYGKTHCAVFGMTWSYPMSDYNIDTPSELGSGHDIPLYWADGDHAIAIQSMGLSAGREGEQAIHRSVVNANAEKYGMFIVIDATPDEVAAAKARNGKLDDPWTKNIIDAFVKTFINDIPTLVKALVAFLTPQSMPIPSGITKLAECLRDYEGKPGDRNYRNCNPGNVRYYSGGYAKKYGNVTKDKDGFAVFPTYDLGWLYLQNMLLNWAKGIYAEETIEHMMTRYAPSSENDTVAYSAYIGKTLGVDPKVVKLKDLIA